MDDSVHPELKPAYAYDWAFNVVNAFKECYPRATEIVYKEFGCTDRMIVWCLANRKPSWENFKKVVQLTDRYLEAQRISGQGEFPAAISSAVRSYATKHLWSKPTEYLTKNLSSAPV